MNINLESNPILYSDLKFNETIFLKGLDANKTNGLISLCLIKWFFTRNKNKQNITVDIQKVQSRGETPNQQPPPPGLLL